jgi:predicted membrane channel-forming protein YqfA (hemolysin III family)
VKRKAVPRSTFWTILGIVLFIVGAGFFVIGILAPRLLTFLEAALYLALGTVALIRMRHTPDSN